MISAPARGRQSDSGELAQTRTIVRQVSSHDEEGRLERLEPAHVAAFKAFQRSARPADQGLRDDPSAAVILEPRQTLDLARRVYDEVEGTIDLVPGPDTICCVAINARNGESMAGSTSTALAATSTHGFIRSGTERSVTVLGVLSAQARDLRIINGSGHAIAVPLNADDAYWITVTDPIDMIVTQADGTTRHIPFARPGSHRITKP